jgi:tRNA (cytidine32/uridine32-2'-O)-methyltransferase
VICYELWMLMRPEAVTPPAPEVPLASAQQMQLFYDHLQDVLDYIEFRDRNGAGYLMSRIRRLFNRANPDLNEINILRGILTAVQQRRRTAKRVEQEKS